MTKKELKKNYRIVPFDPWTLLFDATNIRKRILIMGKKY